VRTSAMPDKRLDATLRILERLISFDTESSKSNLALVSFVEEYFKSLGVSYVKIPNAAGDKAALYATIGQNCDGGIVLSGHTDAVPVAGQHGSAILSNCASRTAAFMGAAPAI
jgi:acetylornithine deacetylase